MRGFQDYSSFSTTVTYAFHDDVLPASPMITKEIPIQSSTTPPTAATDIPVIIHLPEHQTAATKIQSVYRAHVIRCLYRTIASVDSQADEVQRRIQLQETVDAIRKEEKEKLRVNEELMRLLLKLDSVPGVDPAVREARRKVSRRIVGMQEILDGICGAKVDDDEWDLDFDGVGVGVFNWDRTVAEMEAEVCKERGGDEMERFCAQYLGFRCFQRFLREP
ncbi:BAG family molecular chaperone regulator 5, mitochondrial [Linum grandiflorum]